MFSQLASKLLVTIASPAFEKAYEKGRSIWEAKDELHKLQRSIQTIQAGLLDAEKKQESSAAIKDWIERVSDVLYDADDLFDEVATDEMLKQQIIEEGKVLKKVRASCFKLNPIVSRNSIANKVKAIRKSLLEISKDMDQFNFMKLESEQPISSVRKEKEVGSFVDSKVVIGREKDKKTIIELLLDDESNNGEQDVSVIAVVGIGGMGKTTLAQLVYNDEKVQQNFNNRWFACISDTTDDKEILRKISQSQGTKCDVFTLDELKGAINNSVKEKKFLLVLDDVWDEDHSKWIKRMSLLSGCAKRSKVIVTTRSQSVARAMDAVRIHTLGGLSKEESWALFKKVAFTSEQRNNARWMDLGREIVKKCANVPLAIMSIGSLLYTKTTIQEWESFRNIELTQLGESGQDDIMPVLKLSYDHLHSIQKQCFAYCSLFPKDHVFSKHDLIHVWTAQGFIKTTSKVQTVEEIGHSYFMDLFRRSFFQEAEYDDFGEIEKCKMHDLIHDLAQKVAPEKSIMLPTSTIEIKGTPRHIHVGYTAGDSSTNVAPLLNDNRLRSLFIPNTGSTCGLVLDQAFARLRFLRTLKLSHSGIENVPSSIGGLKHLRYLDISGNKFKMLSDSITKLLNLHTLKVDDCSDLEALPDGLRKLVNLRHLEIKGCFQLKHMPPRFGEMVSLQHLDEFKVGRGMDRGQWSKLAELFGLKLRGQLWIRFGDDSNDDDWDGVECCQPLVNLQGLKICGYKGRRIPHWANGNASLLPNLTRLSLHFWPRLKCLPCFRHLPNLKFLSIRWMDELEYIEEEENKGKQNLRVATTASDAFLPYLETLELAFLPKLKGWSSRKVEAAMESKDNVATNANGEEHPSSTSASASACAPQLLSFPSLSSVEILNCEQLQCMPLCPSLCDLSLYRVDAKVIPQLLAVRDNSSPSTTTTSSSSSLKSVDIRRCYGLMSFPGQSLTSLQYLFIENCDVLKRVELPPPHLNILRDLTITRSCRGLDLWEEDKRVVDWGSLQNLCRLYVDEIPSPERLPDQLQNRQALGEFKINGRLMR